MWEYRNGDYTVTILDDGTKIRPSGDLHPEYPESIDVKVTNKCDMGCGYCHEDSQPDGASFDPGDALRLICETPKGIEFAIGGGNPLSCRDELAWLFDALPGAIFNLTVSACHMDGLGDLAPTAIGVSYVPSLYAEIADFVDNHKNVVIHLVAGIHSIEDLAKCRNRFERILILGYKQVGRGARYYDDSVVSSLRDWEAEIGNYLGGRLLAFDNLAVKQLDVARFFTAENWARMYMGDDGAFSMFLDLVKHEYAASSRSATRWTIGEMSIREMFAVVRRLEWSFACR
jgi:hypothetical protein